MKILTKQEAIEGGWEILGPNPMAEKVLTEPYPHTIKTFGVDEDDLLRSISEFEARHASDEHHANLY